MDDDVSQEDIKTAYRQAAKYCHPDVNDAGHELCILLNEVHSGSLADLGYLITAEDGYLIITY